MKRFLLYAFYLGLFFQVNQPCLFASEYQIEFNGYNYSSLDVSEIVKELHSYLSKNLLSPILEEKNIKCEINQIIEEHGAVFVYGKLRQENKCVGLGALFSIRKGWFSTDTNLVYLTTDTPISALLFYDISILAAQLLPKALPNYRVLIQRLYNPDSDFKFQRWTFLNQEESISLLVVLMEDGQNGFYFEVSKWPE